MRRASWISALVAAGVAAVAVIPASAAAPKYPLRAKIRVGDDYFAPVKVRVPPKSRVRFTFLSGNSNTHDVKLKKGPRGVRRWQSDPATAEFSYTRSLRVKGTYRILCTYHVDMEMTIVVR
jgi:plastocyanin